MGQKLSVPCSSLKNITIGSSVTGIGWDAFDDCTDVTRITCFATTPPKLDSGIFNFTNDQYATIPLYVPGESITDYKERDYWKEFKNIRAIDPSGIEGPQIINDDTPSVIYDMQGRRVRETQKGLHIIKGKKVLVR